MTTKHTPGPWHALKYPDVKTWTVAADQSVASKIANEANAQLIAAAPDLLEACRFALEIFNCDPHRSGFNGEQAALKRLQLAIAKAESQ